MLQQTTTINPTLVTSEIMLRFNKYGTADYDGEPVTQAAHMIQCAQMALDEKSDTELVLAAFLHDIGHLLKHEQPVEEMGGFGVLNHEGIGAAYLRSKGFSERVCAVVENHVNAKRFLVATNQAYQQKLSPASIETLKWQGGPMTEEEVANFRQHPFFQEIIRVRYWDEAAKDPYATLLPLTFFETAINDYLTTRNRNAQP